MSDYNIYNFFSPSPESVNALLIVAFKDLSPEDYANEAKLAEALRIFAENSARWGYEQCLGQFEMGAMQIVPPPESSFEDDEH